MSNNVKCNSIDRMYGLGMALSSLWHAFSLYFCITMCFFELCIGRKVGRFKIVMNCPLTETSWKARAQTLKCDGTFMFYHCMRTSKNEFAEFCLEQRMLFTADGCPRLANNAGKYEVIVDGCNNSTCPLSRREEDGFLSNQLYKYPKCLMREVPLALETTTEFQNLTTIYTEQEKTTETNTQVSTYGNKWITDPIPTSDARQQPTVADDDLSATYKILGIGIAMFLLLGLMVFLAVREMKKMKDYEEKLKTVEFTSPEPNAESRSLADHDSVYAEIVDGAFDMVRFPSEEPSDENNDAQNDNNTNDFETSNFDNQTS